MKVQKILEIFSIFLFIVILLLAGGVFGIQSGQAWTKQEEMSETITDIAVVNLDEGIYENNKKRFYSSELMDLEADNIKNFEISLNTNMSYMYVQAILSEFHNVQDLASIIMSNDNAELARLLKINPQDLLANLVTEELKDNYDSFVIRRSYGIS